VYRDIYAPTKATQILPVDTSGDPAAETHSFVTGDGNVSWQLMGEDGHVNDAPSQAIERAKESVGYYSFFHAFGYSINDMRRAQRAGISLSTEQPRLAREGWQRLLDDIAAFGYEGTDL